MWGSFFLLLACSYGRETNLRLILPDLPDPRLSRGGQLSFVVRYPGRDGSVETVELEPGAKTLAVSLPKMMNTPVLAYPVLGWEEGYLLPCGAVFPLDLNGKQELRLSWERGFQADLFMTLLDQGIPLEHFNAPRLCSEIQNKCRGNPWSIDKERLVTVLRFGTFRADYIVQLKEYAVDVDFDKGVYFRSNLLLPGFVSTPGQRKTLEGLGRGYHHFLNSVEKETTTVYITEEEWIVFYPLRERIESGRW